MGRGPIQTPSRPQTACPTCRAPADRGQLVCLECGARVALSYRRPPSWKIPVAISAVLLLLAGVGATLAYQALDDEAETEVASAPAKVSERATQDDEGSANNAGEPPPGRESKPDTSDTDQATEPEPTTTTEKAEPEPSPAADGLVKEGALYAWPRDLDAFTVVLLSNEDRPSAESFAESATEKSDEKIGVIRSDDFQTLGSGFFIVFAGEYPTRQQAIKASTRLERSFPGAFPQAVKP